jgi:hypothetical protein
MVRHAWDWRNPPLHQALAKRIVDNKGDIGLRITSKSIYDEEDISD